MIVIFAYLYIWNYCQAIYIPQLADRVSGGYLWCQTSGLSVYWEIIYNYLSLRLRIRDSFKLPNNTIFDNIDWHKKIKIKCNLLYNSLTTSHLLRNPCAPIGFQPLGCPTILLPKVVSLKMLAMKNYQSPKQDHKMAAVVHRDVILLFAERLDTHCPQHRCIGFYSDHATSIIGVGCTDKSTKLQLTLSCKKGEHGTVYKQLEVKLQNTIPHFAVLWYWLIVPVFSSQWHKWWKIILWMDIVWKDI